MTGPERSGDDDALWAAVSEPGRRRVLDILVAQGTSTPSALARDLPFTRQAVSKHLAVLRDAGLVDHHKSGRETRYAVRADRLAEAVRVMTAAAARWDARLLTIKRLAEELAGKPEEKPKEPGGDGPVTSRPQS